ncbi:transposase-like zinc-binding domain-containing protein [Desulfosarcina variabilis]|uniref:IS1/IS1595 family N-terminal zinc-binding domain-containing protein n=1 Tax=Desulfosarcina variabilis TaxID=2300 RepID=UPI003AFAC328
MMLNNRTRCPECGSDAFYRYGKTQNGKERRICLVCNSQYVVNHSWDEIPDRPNCPVCDKPMHVYQRRSDFIRYRCSNYPKCRQYLKVAIIKKTD